MSVLGGNPLLIAGDDGYQISRSVRLRSSASAYFNRTPAGTGNRKTWTMSMWLKRGTLSTYQMPFSCFQSGGGALGWQLNTDNTFDFYQYNAAYQFRLVSTAVFRDPSAWYHFVFVVDTTQATASDRVKVYVNGVQITAFSTATYPTQNTDLIFNYAQNHNIGQYASNNTNYFNGYLTEINFIDGQALTPSSFGEYNAITGVWQPKKYGGTYGTNGFYLNFSDNSAATAAAIGKDSSGNGNNWTPNNISVTAGVTYDSMLDVPTPYADGGNGRGNFCTGNPLSRHTTNTYNFTNGNLDVEIFDASNVQIQTRMTMGVSSGKWYWEATLLSYTTYQPSLGVAADNVLSGNYVGSTALQWGVYGPTGQKMNNNVSTAYGSAAAVNDVVQIALDMDNGKIWFGKNGTWFASGDPAAGTNAAFTNLAGNTILPAMGVGGATNAGGKYAFNFGQRPFTYTPPTGFKALNTQNLPESTIKKGNAYFDVSTWTGNGSSQSIVNNGAMQPDFLWYKDRSAVSDHRLFDSVRGVTKALYSDATDAEATEASALTSFNSNGFTVGSGSGNTNTRTFVGWQWKKSPSAGFDIVTYTGTGANRTVAHSLGVAPSMIIAKRRNGAQNWFVGHGSFASWSSAIEGLNTTAAVNNGATAVWNATAPTSSVFSVGTDLSASGGTYVAYLFAEVAGFSKFGSYTGNGSADGPFVYCGFRPKFILIKSTATANSWHMVDTSRSTINLATEALWANETSVESTSTTQGIDILSNGFKIRNSTSEMNNSGTSLIYAAFAENPFRNALAR